MKIATIVPLWCATTLTLSIDAFTVPRASVDIKIPVNQQQTSKQYRLKQHLQRTSTPLHATEDGKKEGGFFFARTSVVADVDDEKTTQQPNGAGTKLPSRQDEIRRETDSALASVGWSMPSDGDLTSDDPFVQAIDASIQKDFGVPLDELLNPAKVVNLERDLYVYRTQLAQLTGRAVPDGVKFLVTADCDGGGGGDEADKLRKTISKKEADLIIERRSVFRGWLKNVFLGQAVLSFGVSYVMATNPQQLFGSFDWFYSYNMDISISVLGYWWWWLFVVPSLRSRRPKGFEKKALDYAFIGTPLISLLAPIATKDTGIIWAANLAVVVAAYAIAYATPESDDDDDDSKAPEWLKFVYKSLDFGSGRERGARQ